MKSLSIVCVALALMVAVPFSSTAATGGASGVESARVDNSLMLRPLVQISSQEVLLRDLVIGMSLADVRGDLLICKAPSRGQVRTMTAFEISAVVAHSGLNVEFIGGLRTSIVRMGRRVSVHDLRPLIETALQSSNSTAQIGDVQLQAEISVGDDPGIVLRKLKFDNTTQRFRAFFVATKETGKVNFEATATVISGTAPAEITLASGDGHALHTALLVHRGQPAQMQVSGDGFSATLPVVCFEDGDSGKIVRVREKTSKKNYRAEVIAKDMLRAIQLEN
jgi:hypothetical protein